ncbi:MAG: 1,4-alpha-glucan branching protein GlgB [Streptosporangiales bacterium]|nr:1,4-alpha-glucan branching protein GlgB [Streptosporangiales bacterium]
MSTHRRDEIDRLVAGAHHDPHALLGAHPEAGGVRVSTLRPLAGSVAVVLPDDTRYPLEHEHAGVFSGVLPLREVPDYRLALTYDGGPELVVDDPYRYLPTLGQVDLHLIGEGRHELLWHVLGAHVRGYDSTFGPVTGTSFALWAPNARGVRVTGDFNDWDPRAHPMRSLGGSGVWELFAPGVAEGSRYKYEVLGADGTWRQKADPLAFATETPPATASVVTSTSYVWSDAEWLSARKEREWSGEAMSVYEVHLGSWRAGLGYRELADELVAYVRDMGFTHVELLPVTEHPYGPSWGYQVTSFYAPTARFGSPDDFRYLVDRLHQAGIGVILDWVAAHFPRDAWALAKFDGTALYEHADPRRGDHPEWGTLIFDYGRAEVRNFLVASALYWLEEFHVDGLRVDAVASMLYLDYSREPGEWTPNERGGRENLDAMRFLQELNATCYRRVPGCFTVAEESTAWPGVTKPTDAGGLGFGFKWNMGWMHDTLGYMREDPIHRQYHHNEITFSLVYAFSENYVLPLSHDEVVHGKGSLLGKMPGDGPAKFAGLRTLLGFMWAHPGKQLLFMGGEIAQGAEWAEQRPLDWWLLDDELHAGTQRLVRDLNAVYRRTPALWTQDTKPEGFAWIDAGDAAGNVLTFLRWGTDGGVLACLANFSGSEHSRYRVGLPYPGVWREVLNTDAVGYGGSGGGNLGQVTAEDLPWNGRAASALVTLPANTVLYLRPETEA